MLSDGPRQYVAGTWSLSSPAVQSYQLPVSLGQVLCSSQVYEPTHAPTHPPTQNHLLLPKWLLLHYTLGQGPECGCRKGQGWECQVIGWGTWPPVKTFTTLNSKNKTLWQVKRRIAEERGGNFSLLFEWNPLDYHFALGPSLHSRTCMIQSQNSDC